ncbi:MAG: site-2 protease family protein [Planctomycetes bacterium]|nr:site-2 protease family protein [Planctomycetota bacterium]
MAETARSWMRMLSGIFWVAVLIAVGYLIARNLGVAGNVVVVLLGFGSVVLVHEFGHFIIAKLGGIRVEAFSIFMPPTLLGIRKTRSGFKLRFLPSLYGRRGDEEPAEAEEATEYRIGIFPFGGYVKLLGQEDTGPVKQVSDPRSFANKSVGIRAAVIAAGVTFNVISAALIFMVVFLVGIHLPPAVVGDVTPRSPAAQAGLRPGDEVLKINGKGKDLDFSNILLAAALSDADEPVALTVQHADGTTQDVTLLAQSSPGSQFRDFGVTQPLSLKVAAIAEPNTLQERTGLLPGDRITRVNGRPVEQYWDFAGIVRETLTPTIQIAAERSQKSRTVELVQTELPLSWTVSDNGDVKTEADLNHVYSMVPRVRVMDVDRDHRPAGNGRSNGSEHLLPGDIIVAAAQTQNPTYKELRDITAEYEGKPLPLQVLRTDANGVEQTVAVNVTPERDPGSKRVVIGFLPSLDARHAVVAKTVSAAGRPDAVEIPRGARIVRVNDKPVASFHDVVAEVKRWPGQPVTLQYRLDDQAEGGVTLLAAWTERPVSVQSVLAESVPFRQMERLYQARNPVHALSMGYHRTWTFIAQTYITLKRLISGLISPQNLMGPVGIITVSYQIVAEQPLVNYVYFLGLISATIAVINFLPIPPFDGGLIVLMLVEKVKGSALNERTQGILAYAGWAMVLLLLIYVTRNDIGRIF